MSDSEEEAEEEEEKKRRRTMSTPEPTRCISNLLSRWKGHAHP
jgi:hypothetical protein